MMRPRNTAAPFDAHAASDLWQALKHRLIAERGADGAADFLEHAAAVLRSEARIKRPATSVRGAP